jgi:hypothetical protein
MTAVTAYGDEFAKALALAITCAAPDVGPRPILHGVKVERRPDGLRLVAADNYRLVAVPVREVREGADPEPEPWEAVLGLADAKRLLRIVRMAPRRPRPTVTLDLSQNGVTVSCEGIGATFRAVSGTYPDFGPILAGTYETTAPEVDPMTVWLNPMLLGEVLSGLGKRGAAMVSITARGPLRPILIEGYAGDTDEPLRAALMPIRHEPTPVVAAPAPDPAGE